jgi:hypothetical protein
MKTAKKLDKEFDKKLNEKLPAFAETVILTIKEALAQPKARLAALEAHCQSLEQRVTEQAARILELEAQKYAVDHVER